MQLKQKSDQLQAEANAKRNVYVLNQDVKSGQIITEDMFSTLQVNQDAIPSNATATSSVISTWYLQTKDGKGFVSASSLSSALSALRNNMTSTGYGIRRAIDELREW